MRNFAYLTLIFFILIYTIVPQTYAQEDGNNNGDNNGGGGDQTQDSGGQDVTSEQTSGSNDQPQDQQQDQPDGDQQTEEGRTDGFTDVGTTGYDFSSGFGGESEGDWDERSQAIETVQDVMDTADAAADRVDTALANLNSDPTNPDFQAEYDNALSAERDAMADVGLYTDVFGKVNEAEAAAAATDESRRDAITEGLNNGTMTMAQAAENTRADVFAAGVANTQAARDNPELAVAQALEALGANAGPSDRGGVASIITGLTTNDVDKAADAAATAVGGGRVGYEAYSATVNSSNISGNVSESTKADLITNEGKDRGYAPADIATMLGANNISEAAAITAISTAFGTTSATVQAQISAGHSAGLAGGVQAVGLPTGTSLAAAVAPVTNPSSGNATAPQNVVTAVASAERNENNQFTQTGLNSIVAAAIQSPTPMSAEALGTYLSSMQGSGITPSGIRDAYDAYMATHTGAAFNGNGNYGNNAANAFANARDNGAREVRDVTVANPGTAIASATAPVAPPAAAPAAPAPQSGPTARDNGAITTETTTGPDGKTFTVSSMTYDVPGQGSFSVISSYDVNGTRQTSTISVGGGAGVTVNGQHFDPGYSITSTEVHVTQNGLVNANGAPATGSQALSALK